MRPAPPRLDAANMTTQPPPGEPPSFSNTRPTSIQRERGNRVGPFDRAKRPPRDNLSVAPPTVSNTHRTTASHQKAAVPITQRRMVISAMFVAAKPIARFVSAAVTSSQAPRLKFQITPAAPWLQPVLGRSSHQGNHRRHSPFHFVQCLPRWATLRDLPAGIPQSRGLSRIARRAANVIVPEFRQTATINSSLEVR